MRRGSTVALRVNCPTSPSVYPGGRPARGGSVTWMTRSSEARWAEPRAPPAEVEAHLPGVQIARVEREDRHLLGALGDVPRAAHHRVHPLVGAGALGELDAEEVGERRVVVRGDLRRPDAQVDVERERHLLAHDDALLVDDGAEEDARVGRGGQRQLGRGAGPGAGVVFLRGVATEGELEVEAGPARHQEGVVRRLLSPRPAGGGHHLDRHGRARDAAPVPLHGGGGDGEAPGLLRHELPGGADADLDTVCPRPPWLIEHLRGLALARRR